MPLSSLSGGVAFLSPRPGCLVLPVPAGCGRESFPKAYYKHVNTSSELVSEGHFPIYFALNFQGNLEGRVPPLCQKRAFLEPHI